MNMTGLPPWPMTFGALPGGLFGVLSLAFSAPFGPFFIITLVFAASCVGLGVTLAVILSRIGDGSDGLHPGPPEVVFLTDAPPGAETKPRRPLSLAFLGTLVGVFGAVVSPTTLTFTGEWAVAVILAGGAFGMATGAALDQARRALAARPSRRPGGFAGARNDPVLIWKMSRRQGFPGPIFVGALLGTLGASISPSLVPTEEGLLVQILAGAVLGAAGGVVWKMTYDATLDRVLSSQGVDGPAPERRPPAA
jgi:hypothetical protein